MSQKAPHVDGVARTSRKTPGYTSLQRGELLRSQHCLRGIRSALGT
jgi:hypothetical protein